jgi:hypothetical protein
MKTVIANRDINDPDDVKVVSPVEIDLDDLRNEFDAEAKRREKEAKIASRRAQCAAANEERARQYAAVDARLEAAYPLVHFSKPKHHCSAKRVGSDKKWEVMLIDLLAERPDMRSWTCAKLAEVINKDLDSLRITNKTLSVPLSGFTKINVGKRLLDHGFGWIDLEKNRSLSKIKKAMASGRSPSETSHSKCITLALEFRECGWLINGYSVPIVTSGDGRRRVRMGGLDLDADRLRSWLLSFAG